MDLKERIMGLDYGSKTIGVAISDSLGLTAQPFETIERSKENKLRRSLAKIAKIVEEKNIKKIETKDVEALIEVENINELLKLIKESEYIFSPLFIKINSLQRETISLKL